MSAIITVDDRGRIKLPKTLAKPGDKLLVINAGKKIILLPIPPKPLTASSGWLKIELGNKKISIIADEEAMKELDNKLRRLIEHAD